MLGVGKVRGIERTPPGALVLSASGLLGSQHTAKPVRRGSNCGGKSCLVSSQTLGEAFHKYVRGGIKI